MGRPRKALAKRTASGGIQRDGIEKMKGAAAHVIDRRCAYLGWNSRDPERIKLARDQAGTVLDCLALHGVLTHRAVAGINAYAATCERYRRAVGIPSPHAASSQLGQGPQGQAPDDDDDDIQERARRAAAAYMAAVGAAQTIAPNATSVLNGITSRDFGSSIADDIAAIGSARMVCIEQLGAALHEHFGLG